MTPRCLGCPQAYLCSAGAPGVTILASAATGRTWEARESTRARLRAPLPGPIHLVHSSEPTCFPPKAFLSPQTRPVRQSSNYEDCTESGQQKQYWEIPHELRGLLRRALRQVHHHGGTSAAPGRDAGIARGCTTLDWVHLPGPPPLKPTFHSRGRPRAPPAVPITIDDK